MKALLIILILLTALILGVAIGVQCHRRLAKKQASPKISELPHIPEDAVLNSLNRGQRRERMCMTKRTVCFAQAGFCPTAALFRCNITAWVKKSCLNC